MIGAVMFASASLLCALAPTIAALIAVRLLQGIGGALLTPGSLAMIEASFCRQDRPRAIGAWSGMTGVASALGPLLGGYLVGAVSWCAAFYINLPLGAFVLLFARHVPETRDPCDSGRLDVAGAALALVALAGSNYALDRSTQRLLGGGYVVGRGAGAGGAAGVHRRGARKRQSDAPAGHLHAPVHFREPGHVCGLRRARRLLLPARVVPADLAGVLAAGSRRGILAGDAADAAVLVALGFAGAENRAAPCRSPRDRF